MIEATKLEYVTKRWNPNVGTENDEERYLAIAHQRQPSARRWLHSKIVAETWPWTFFGVIFTCFCEAVRTTFSLSLCRKLQLAIPKTASMILSLKFARRHVVVNHNYRELGVKIGRVLYIYIFYIKITKNLNYFWYYTKILDRLLGTNSVHAKCPGKNELQFSWWNEISFSRAVTT